MKNIITKISIFLATIMLSSTALAVGGEGLTGSVESGITLMKVLAIFAWSVAMFIGLIFLVRAAMLMSKHNEDKREAPIGKIILNALAGAILLGLGFTSDTIQETLFGGTSSDGGGDGADLGEFGKEYENR